jgi:hypothetical protein
MTIWSCLARHDMGLGAVFSFLGLDYIMVGFSCCIPFCSVSRWYSRSASEDMLELGREAGKGRGGKGREGDRREGQGVDLELVLSQYTLLALGHCTQP